MRESSTSCSPRAQEIAGTIKLVKVFGARAPLAGLLAVSLVGRDAEILREVLRQVARVRVHPHARGGGHDELPKSKSYVRAAAVDKLKDMLEDNDPNIKFLALHALTFLLESHPGPSVPST